MAPGNIDQNVKEYRSYYKSITLSVLDVLYRLLGGPELADRCGDQLFHLLSSAEDGDGLLVLV